MAFLGNMRIGFRLGGGFFLVVAAFAGVALFQVLAMDRLGGLAAQVEDRAKDAQILGEVDSRYEALSTLAAELLAGVEPAKIRTPWCVAGPRPPSTAPRWSASRTATRKRPRP